MSRHQIDRLPTHHQTGSVITGDAFNNYNAFVYLPASASTTCTTADTWYVVSGTFAVIEDVLDGFAPTATPVAGLMYLGTSPQWFDVDWSATMTIGVGSATVHIGVGIDEVVASSSVSGQIVITTANAMSGFAAVQMSYGQVATFYLKSDANGDEIDVKHFTSRIKPSKKSPAL